MYDGGCPCLRMCPCLGLFFSGDFGKGDSGWSSALVEES